MTSPQRFRETMRYGSPDRVPYFEEGIRAEVLRVWRRQGMPRAMDLRQRYAADPRREIELDLEPHPPLNRWPTARADLPAFERRLDPGDPRRRPRSWGRFVRSIRKQKAVRMLRVHRGLFLTMGVQAWQRFYEVMLLLAGDPEVVRAAMRIQGRFAAALAENYLSRIQFDAAVFSEPIGGNNGPLISPDMYEDVALRSYEPLLQVLKRFGVETLIFRTYANARILIPRLLKWGFNCLWACEVDHAAMDYRSLRREFGRDLRLIGGLDLDALRQSKAQIRRELNEKIPPLLEQGGYVPLADGRVRADVPFEHYLYYRQLLQELTQK